MYSQLASALVLGTVAAALLADSSPRQTEASTHFEYKSTLLLDDTRHPSANVSIGDVDGDGDFDVLVAKGRHRPFVNRMFLNDGKGTFSPSDVFTTADRTYSAVLADLDGDGDVDIVVSNDRPDEKLVYLNDGKGQFTVGSRWGDPAWPTRNVTVADLNGDGRADLIAANRPGPSFFCINDGQGEFGECQPIDIPATTILAGDFNNDGKVDLAVPHRDGGQSLLLLNDGRAQFLKRAPFGPPTIASRTGAVGDLNKDGWLDIVLGDDRAGPLIFLNDGKGGVGEAQQLGDDEKFTPFAAAIHDMNADGAQDVILGSSAGPGSVFFGDGTGRRFTEVRFGQEPGAIYGLDVGDLNGDGHPDIAAARSGAPNVVFFAAPASTAAASAVTLKPYAPVTYQFDPIPRNASNPLIGVWEGRALQGGQDAYGVELLIERSDGADVSIKTAYKGAYNCLAVNTIQEKRADGTYVLGETVKSGRGCDDGRVEIRLTEDGRIHWAWYAVGTTSQPIVVASLTRKE